MRSRLALSLVALALAALVAAPAQAAPRAGALYRGHSARATVRLGVAGDAGALPDYAFTARGGRCNDGTRWISGEDERGEPSIDVTRRGTFAASLPDRGTYTHRDASGHTRTWRVRFAFHVRGRFSASGRTVRGTFRQSLRAVRHGGLACHTGLVHFTATARGAHPGLTLELEQDTLTIGDHLEVVGRYVAGGRGTGEVAVYGRPAGGGAEEQLATAPLGRAGHYRASVRPDRDMRLRVAALPTAGEATAHSDPAHLEVYTHSHLGLRRAGRRLVASWSIVGHHVERGHVGPTLYFYFRPTGRRTFRLVGSRTLRRTAREGFTSTLAAALSFRSRQGGTAAVCVRRRPYPDMHGFVPLRGCGRRTHAF